jgi:hypothetical protein
MQTKQAISKGNPLTSYMRQPKIYIRLPSQGQYWAPGSLAVSENGEYPVYSMTARDEMMFKTPDALMNGQAMVDVIQSCLPNIKNAWDIPTIDFDTILIAMRIATYGEHMPINHSIPVINEDVEYAVDLKVLLEQQQNNHWIDQVIINSDFVIYVKPLTFRHMTQSSIKSFETSRILNIINDEKLSDEKKLEVFNESFNNLTRVTVDLLTETIYKIETPQDEVTDRKFISEFIANVDKEVFKKIQDHINDLKIANELKPLEFVTTEEQQALGAPANYTVPINFNNSDFFG